MKFRNWVKARGGPTQVAALLKMESMAVNQWLWGNATPKALIMQKLVKLGKGAFDYDDIINETKKQGAKR